MGPAHLGIGDVGCRRRSWFGPLVVDRRCKAVQAASTVTSGAAHGWAMSKVGGRRCSKFLLRRQPAGGQAGSAGSFRQMRTLPTLSAAQVATILAQ